MATYSVVKAKHATLGAAAVDIVNLSGGTAICVVKNRGTAGDIYFTVDGTVPVSAADDTYVLTPGSIVTIRADQGKTPSTITQVKLISAGTPAYSVEAY